MGPLDQLQVNQAKYVRFDGGVDAAVVRLADGRIVAVDDECCHKSSSLCGYGFNADIEDLGPEISSKVGDGSKCGGVCIRCPFHRQKFNGGLWFSVVTGKAYVKGKCSKFNPRWTLKKYYPHVVQEEGVDIVYLHTSPSKDGPKKSVGSGVQEVKVQADTLKQLEQLTIGAQDPKDSMIPWRLKSRTLVNQSTFIFHFVCTDVASLSLLPSFDAWHISLTTSPRGSTPCRDYTPVSTMRELREGRLRLLIKIYPQGQLTPKLAALKDGETVLVGDLEETVSATFFTGATHVAMVIGGTGITPAMQILEAALQSTVSLPFPFCSLTDLRFP